MSLLDRIQLFYVSLIYTIRQLAINGLRSLLFSNVSTPKSIVIHRVAAFGDSVVTLPALNLIRKRFPDSRIDLVSTAVVGINIKDIVSGSGVVDNVYLYTKKERKQALKDVKERGYDLYIEIPQNLNLYKSIRNMLLVRFHLGIKAAFGWDKGRLKRFARVQKKYLNIPREVDRFLSILSAHGIHGEAEFPVFIDATDQAVVDSVIGGAETPAVAFLIGGKLEQKKWPLDRWVVLAKRLSADYQLYLVGGPQEVDEANYIAERVPGLESLCGKFSIKQSAAFLRRMSAVISLDTGAMHLAYAVGTPVVALFSTRDITSKWFPYGERHKVIEKEIDCSYCFSKTCSNNRCMQLISVDEVHGTFLAMMGK